MIEEASFTGHGCAISQASADIMADLITGETVKEAKRLSGLFLAMIRGDELSEEDYEDLDEAGAAQGHLTYAARVKCAELAWATLDECLTSRHKIAFGKQVVRTGSGTGQRAAASAQRMRFCLFSCISMSLDSCRRCRDAVI